VIRKFIKDIITAYDHVHSSGARHISGFPPLLLFMILPLFIYMTIMSEFELRFVIATIALMAIIIGSFSLIVYFDKLTHPKNK
jgi:hypothetical protein